MKTFISVIILLAFIGLSGCSDKNQSPVAPNDQASLQKDQASLEKIAITKFTIKRDYPVGLISPGEIKLVNNILTMRNVVTKDRYETTTPLVTGTAINTVNQIANQVIHKGIIWGTFIITPEASEAGGGTWDCVYTGIGTKTGESEWKTYLHGTGRGKGGTINGMLYSVDLVIVSWNNPPTYWEGSGTGHLTSFRTH